MKDCRDKIDGIVENIPMHHGEICFCSVRFKNYLSAHQHGFRDILV